VGLQQLLGGQGDLSGVAALGVGDDVAALHIRLDVSMAPGGEHLAEAGHRHHRLAADVDAAEQEHEVGHRGRASHVRAGRRAARPSGLGGAPAPVRW
jgi:hypothetical protein